MPASLRASVPVARPHSDDKNGCVTSVQLAASHPFTHVQVQGQCLIAAVPSSSAATYFGRLCLRALPLWQPNLARRSADIGLARLRPRWCQFVRAWLLRWCQILRAWFCLSCTRRVVPYLVSVSSFARVHALPTPFQDRGRVLVVCGPSAADPAESAVAV